MPTKQGRYVLHLDLDSYYGSNSVRIVIPEIDWEQTKVHYLDEPAHSEVTITCVDYEEAEEQTD